MSKRSRSRRSFVSSRFMSSRSHFRDARRRRISMEALEDRRLLMADFTLELLHLSDQEASTPAIQDAPRLSAVLNALRDEDLGGDGLPDNTLTLSSGDAFIPGVFFDASEEAFGSGGIADIQIQNELGIQAIALGNHEFDKGTQVLADLISGDAVGDIFGDDFTGTDFPYLASNLNFAPDAALAPLEVAGGAEPMPNSVTSSTVIDVNGEYIGVVGAITPTLPVISSPDDVGVAPDPFDPNPSDEQLDALVTIIQADVDLLLADATKSIDKVIVLAHMQQFDIEFALAERLSNVDIIVAGGSNTRLFDEDDRPRDGDSVQGEYPTFITNAGGSQTAVVNTDGSYKYVGRLVLEFDADGNIIPESYDPAISGAYATDDQGVTDLGAEEMVDPEIQAIVDAIEAEIIASESNVFGIAEVFLNGNRSGTDDPLDPDGVRTQETNLGNLTADANLAEAQQADPSVVVSIKNGGGIRASIGQTVVPPGGSEAERLPNEELLDSEGNVIKPEGGISENDIATTLAFNNGLTLLTLTRAELIAVLEHAIGAIPGVSGRFPQLAGVKLSYDSTLPEGSRIINAAIVDGDGQVTAPLVERGTTVGDPSETFRIVTLSFLAGGGDGYPFPTDPSADRVDLENEGVQSGNATFADDGTEQDALAEYLFDNFLATPITSEDVGRHLDQRIQDVQFRADTVYPQNGTVAVTNGLDAGVGSFRNAVQIANDNPGVSRIAFRRMVDQVRLHSTVEFTGDQPLAITGQKHTTIKADPAGGEFDLLVSSGGADLDLRNLTFHGAGFDGLSIPIPADAIGLIRLDLEYVNFIGNGLYGLHIDDQTDNSAASIQLDMFEVKVLENGFLPGFDDFDGIRIDEGGEGGVYVNANNVEVIGNAADGFEIDEKGFGSVILTASNSKFNENGPQPQLPSDLEDGLDIDEAGDGSVIVSLLNVNADDNFDEGIDFDEEGRGDIITTLTHVTAHRNRDEGIKLSEDADAEPPDEGEAPDNESASGNIFAQFYGVSVRMNGDDGIEFEEFGPGDINAGLFVVHAKQNFGSGFQATEGSEDYPDDIADEQNAGSLIVMVSNSVFRGNNDAGIEVEQIGPGFGVLRVFPTRFSTNFEGSVIANDVRVLLF